PPKTPSAGRTIGTIAAAASAIRSASSSTTRRAIASPRRAAANTFLADSGGSIPSRRAVATTPDAPAPVSSTPRRRRTLSPGARPLGGEPTSPAAQDLGPGVPAGGEVAPLAGGARVPAVELAPQDQAGADARPDVQVDEVLDALAETEPLLAQCGQVHVVLERTLRPELLLDGLGETAPSPTRERVREGDVSGDRIEDPGAPDRGERDLLPLPAALGGRRVRDLADLRDQRALAPDPSPLVATGNDLAGQVGDRGSDEIPA